MEKLHGEPSLDKIDDYKGKESKEKRNTVRFVVIFCLVVGAIFAYLKTPSTTQDVVETKEQPKVTETK